MQNAIVALLTQLFSVFGALSPFAKAIAPAATGLVASLVNMAFAGAFNTASLVILGVGVLSGALTYLTKNVVKPAPAKAKVSK